MGDVRYLKRGESAASLIEGKKIGSTERIINMKNSQVSSPHIINKKQSPFMSKLMI